MREAHQTFDRRLKMRRLGKRGGLLPLPLQEKWEVLLGIRLLWTTFWSGFVKPSGSHCTDALGGKEYRRVPTPLRSPSPFSDPGLTGTCLGWLQPGRAPVWWVAEPTLASFPSSGAARRLGEIWVTRIYTDRIYTDRISCKINSLGRVCTTSIKPLWVYLCVSRSPSGSERWGRFELQIARRCIAPAAAR